MTKDNTAAHADQHGKGWPTKQPQPRDGKSGSLAEGQFAQDLDIDNVAATSREEVDEKKKDRS